MDAKLADICAARQQHHPSYRWSRIRQNSPFLAILGRERSPTMRTLCTPLPKPTVWTPDDVLSSIGLGMNAEDQDNIDGDVDSMCSLGRTPTRETECLFLGGNLESYRTASEANPYKRESNE
ncbi:hypothetical protein GGD63_003412 [Bradyrhizobium sp. cir1]|uniref:hypothetical protein n=1 Tax=Bradyrhizobium sp. cir1 TaxID=1445730 RepID=UPI00179C1EC4|nr:hypothetical protein [Bradyrhizobium sp. cir1]MBB4370617.1 hypothetical protein [Bradyrhizobium sp. cir1]